MTFDKEDTSSSEDNHSGDDEFPYTYLEKVGKIGSTLLSTTTIPDVLVVREGYVELREKIEKRKFRGTAVTGNPGIGSQRSLLSQVKTMITSMTLINRQNDLPHLPPPPPA